MQTVRIIDFVGNNDEFFKTSIASYEMNKAIFNKPDLIDWTGVEYVTYQAIELLYDYMKDNQVLNTNISSDLFHSMLARIVEYKESMRS